MALRVAINGFGRIGRNVLRAIAESGRKDIEVVGINDLGPVETNAHLLRFDSVHGRFPGTVTVDGDSLNLGNGKAVGVRSYYVDTNRWNGTLDEMRAYFGLGEVVPPEPEPPVEKLFDAKVTTDKGIR